MPLLTRRAVGLLVPAANVAYNGTSVQAALDGQAATQQSIQAELEANYRLEVLAGAPLPPVTVPAGSTVLYPLPAISPAPRTWRAEFWANVSGIIVGSNDVAGVYETAITIAFSDSAGSETVWSWTLGRGRDFDSTPVFGDRVSKPVQLSVLGEPDGCSLHGTFAMPDTGPDTEIGLFVSHNRGVSVDVTVESLQFVMYKEGDLDQV